MGRQGESQEREILDTEHKFKYSIVLVKILIFEEMFCHSLFIKS